MHNFPRDFQLFIARGNVLDLTALIVISAAFGGVTTSLVDDVLMPPLGYLVGWIDFQALVLRLNDSVVICYGAFLNTLVNFVVALFAMFLVVRGVATVQNLRRKETETEEAAEVLPLLRPPYSPKSTICWPPKGPPPRPSGKIRGWPKPATSPTCRPKPAPTASCPSRGARSGSAIGRMCATAPSAAAVRLKARSGGVFQNRLMKRRGGLEQRHPESKPDHRKQHIVPVIRSFK